MLGCKLLKHFLGKHGLCNGVVNLKKNKTQLGEVVHKNSAISVLLLGERPLQLGKKSPPLLIPFGQLRLSPLVWRQQIFCQKMPTLCCAKVAWSLRQIDIIALGGLEL
jgi:hypothetical protein